MTKKNDTFKLILQEADGTIKHEEYSAFIGIEVSEKSVKLHIRENGDLDEGWWRAFPALLQNTIEEGLKHRGSRLKE
jgi:hypothetical protein